MIKKVLNRNNDSVKRFLIPLQKLSLIISKATSQENIPLAYYQSEARQHFFYLEALCSIYKSISNKKLFKKLQIKFKSLEDQLGKIDYYDSLHKIFSDTKNCPIVFLNQLFQHYQNELNNLNTLLIDGDWTNEKKIEIDKIINQLNKVNWLDPEKEKKAVSKALLKEIKSILKDYKSEKINFDKIEEGVHEFRRKIRWISISAQALNGLIQLKKDEKTSNFKKYLTKKVMDSPFNKLPKNKADLDAIEFSESAFYALSWLIAESGNLKDQGLELICMEKLIKETNFIHDVKAITEINKFTPNVKLSLKEIKTKMKNLADTFIYEDKVFDVFKRDLKVF